MRGVQAEYQDQRPARIGFDASGPTGESESMATPLRPFDGKLDDPTPATGLQPFDGTLDGEEPKASVGGRLKDLGLSVAKGVVGVPEAAVGLANIATGGRAGKFLENEGGAVGFRPKQAKEYLSSLQSDAFKAEQQQFQDADGILNKAGVALTNPALVGNALAESAPLMLGGGAVARGIGAVAPSVAGRVGTVAAGEGAIMAGSQAEQIRQQTEDGLLTPTQSALAAGTGLVGAGLNLAGAGLARRLGVGDIDQMIAGGTTAGGRQGLGMLNRAGRGALTEGVFEELPQSLAETGLQNLALDRPFTEGMQDAAVLGTLTGGLMGAGAGVLSGSGRQPQEAQPEQPQADAERSPTPPEGEPDMGNPTSDAVTGNPATMGAPLTDTGAGMLAAPTDPLRSIVRPSQAMGIDPAAGPLSRAAAQAVDSGASPVAQSSVQESQSTAPDLTTRTTEELRAALRNAQEPSIRRVVSDELRRRREAERAAMPDPMPDPMPADQSAMLPFDPAPVRQPMGQPLTETGLTRTDALRDPIQGEQDARRTADGLRGSDGASTGAGSNLTGAGVGTDVGSVGGRGTDTADAQPDVPRSDSSAGTSPAGAVPALTRPRNWRGNAIQARKVARALGIPTEGKRLAQIVAEIDVVDAGTNVQNPPQGTAGTRTEAPAVEAPAPAGGNATAAAGSPGAGQGAGVRADGVKRQRPTEESQQDRSIREWTENYDRIANTDDLSTVETKDIVRAIAWASRKKQSEARKGWDGGEPNQNLLQALDAEIARLRAEELRRATPATAGVPAEAGGRGEQADGVSDDVSTNTPKVNTSAEPAQKTAKSKQVDPTPPAESKPDQETAQAADDAAPAQQEAQQASEFNAQAAWDAMTPAARGTILDKWAGAGQTDMGERYKSRAWGSFNAGEKSTLTAVLKAAQDPASDDRDTFTLQRLNRETNQMDPVTFKRGEYVEVTLIGSDKNDYGEIDGISQARREFSVNGLWHTMGAAYKAERPAAPARKDMAPLSSVIDKMNAKNGEGLTEADRVPEQKPASKTPTVDRHEALMKSVREGKATADQFKSAFESLVANKDAVIAELETKTKAELLKAGGYQYFQTRYANEKKADVAQALYRELLDDYSLGDGYSYGMGKNAKEEAVRRIVEATDDAKLKQYAKDRQAAIAEAQAERAAKAAAMDNPQTLADFKAIIAKHIGEGKSAREAFLALTPEQRIQFDTLAAESTREAREARKRERKTEVRAAGQTTGGEIIATKHTRDGYDLFVVQLSDRLSKEDYTTVLASAKRLGGWYSSFRGNGAIPGFQFKDRSNAEAFLQLAGGDTTAAQAQAEQRRDAFEDDRSQSAVERLREMADKMEDAASAEMSRERKTNTARRAKFYRAAMNAAEANVAAAKTMRNIAQAIEDGRAKFLDGVRTKTQVELLSATVRTAKDNELRAKYDSYAEQEKRRGEPPTAETADFAEFPSYTAFRSDLATLGRQMLEVEGAKKLGQQLMKVADDVSDSYLEFAKEPGNLFKLSTFSVRRGEKLDTAIFPSKDQAESAIKRSGLTGKAIVFVEKRGVNRIIMSPSEAINSGVWTGDGDKRITLTSEFGSELVEAIGRRGNKANGLTVPWQFQNTYDRRKALALIGIETPSEFRSALREFIALQERAVANKVRELELQMVGRRNDGLDFFPTPAEVADQMVEAADLTPEMAVLEPSAGMGHIADRIREAGAEPDVIELSSDRRELLLEKGYHLAEVDDFINMEPRKFFTYGDVFRAPDGTEGIMRGVSQSRVRLEDEQGNRLGLYDRDELTGVGHRGSWSGYDRIIMNPPFSNRRDAEHVRHAYTLLKPGGRIVAIMGEGVFFGQDKKAQDFREWMDSVGGTSEKLPAGSFMDPSLPVNTGVSARMVVIDKPAGDTQLRMADPTQAATPAETSAATPENQRIVASLSDSINAQRALKGSPAINFQAVEPAEGATGQLARAVAKTAKRIFNREIVYVKFEGQPLFNGAVSKLHPGKIFVNIDSERPFMAVLGHELLHELAKSNPGTYANLSRRLNRVMRNQNIYSERLKAKYRQQGQPLPVDILEELEADIVGDNFMDPKFWEEMSREQPGLFRAMANQIIRWLDNVAARITRMRPFGTEMYLSDIAAARSAVADAMREFSQTQGQSRVQSDSRLSVADRTPQTETAAFKRWFAGSKVVNPDGSPMVVYHGTKSDFSTFNQDQGRHAQYFGDGIYLTDDAGQAASYAGQESGANVMPVYASLKNPFIEGESRFNRGKAFVATELRKDLIQKRYEKAGFDGVVLKRGWVIAFRPEQIKSATGNQGTFDPESPDIRFSIADAGNFRQKISEVIPPAVYNNLTDLTDSQRGLNRWWHRTVGTQLHKAKVNKPFGKVYYAVQDFMRDVSRTATIAADKAPTLLKQIESLGDVARTIPMLTNPAKMRERKASLKQASDALFDGTLKFRRNGRGEVVEATDSQEAGIVWTREELKERGASDEAIQMYFESRAAIDQSLDTMLAADVYRVLTATDPELVVSDPTQWEAFTDSVRKAVASDTPLDGVSQVIDAVTARTEVFKGQIASLRKLLAKAEGEEAVLIQAAMKEPSDKLEAAEKALEQMTDKRERIQNLQARGYAPLMRFGEYAVGVTNEAGERVFFGLYESQRAANQAARKFRDQGLTVSQSIMSKREFEQLKGLSPETAMLFAEMLGVEKNEAMQTWLQNAVAEQSALKRHIRRKGVSGFDDDASRVLAAFIMSNSRAASRAIHGYRIEQAVENVQAGDVKDEAIALADYVNNPKEEAQAIRSLLFVNYIGGSVSSALVNLTQTFVQTYPFLSQYGGAVKAGQRVTSAMKQALGKVTDPELSAALKRAEADGIVKPQEVFQLQAEASRNLGSNLYARTALAAWGSFFQLAEQYNRRVAFIAAYNTAKGEGIANPFAFAENAVEESQGVFNKGNRPNWARGAVGATLFTFKGFTIQYVEFLKRLPPKERAIALGVLFLMAGAGGLPFAEDVEDLIDTVAQAMGYNFTSKSARDTFLRENLGDGWATFIQNGVSPWTPFDVSQRLGMADLLPGTALLKKSETRKDDQVLEIFGVAGSFVRDALKGEVRPIAVRNAAKALEMYDMGIYRDTRGRTVMEVDALDALLKSIGLQPSNVARESRAVGMQYEKKALFQKVKSGITEQMALGYFENDQDKIAAAQEALRSWNQKNPEATIVLSAPAVWSRVRQMRMDRTERFLKAAPKELRGQMGETLR